MNGTISKVYTGNIGWSSPTKHAVHVNEHEDGNSFSGTPHALCAPNTGMHYRIGGITQLKRVQATHENVTCKKCLTHVAQ